MSCVLKPNRGKDFADGDLLRVFEGDDSRWLVKGTSEDGLKYSFEGEDRGESESAPLQIDGESLLLGGGVDSSYHRSILDAVHVNSSYYRPILHTVHVGNGNNVSILHAVHVHNSNSYNSPTL